MHVGVWVCGCVFEDAEAGAKKKSVAQLMSQKRAAKALKFAQGPSKDRCMRVCGYVHTKHAHAHART